MNTYQFATTSRVMSVAETLIRDCTRLKNLAHKAQLIETITATTEGADVKVSFSGSDTHNICGSLCMVFKQEELISSLEVMHLAVDAEIREICSKYPPELFSLPDLTNR